MQLPQFTEQFDAAHPSDEMGCEECDHTWISIEDIFALSHYHPPCPECGGTKTWAMWEQGERCPNCGKLDFGMQVEGCCSRACHLQYEYSKQLKGE